MSYELLGIIVLWIFLYGYLIVASVDFGAGFFSYYSEITGNKQLIQPMIERYLSPVWEVTNVFLIFFMVGLIGFFPDTAYYYGTSLLIPGSIAVILLAIRGSYYAFSTYGAKNNRFYLFLYGASGWLIPAALSTVLIISEGGFIKVINGDVQFQYMELFTSSYAWTVVGLALISVLYISSMFLSYYAYKAKDHKAFEIVRKYALAWSLPTIVASFLVFFSIRNHNVEHFEKMVDLSWMFVISFICFIVAVYFVWKRKKLGWAFVFVMFQFAFAFFGYGASHLPYILYPYINIHEHFTNQTMAIALVTVFILGLLLLVPSLYLLMRLFLFDIKYVQGNKNPQK
ncbi:cytochrome d ubiquinol oxidase subunit II [Chengkuizengella sediminis]|uniref:cytochrome d ubiquinol oxidase subunit II n=1 Tax=Chengkuizengella sediminis TaxID=1885917 RepID=UPI00138A1ED1|nr:cytochrome d ubiquinol oxidase subunit II [Chengkuizengella sediminis]NDI36329.1 cytochrome d ubiquinol oxidase subunit II [Chengkuizengella sediminis]